MVAPTLRLDREVIDRLLPDLVGHDRRPSAFLVYLVILGAAADGRVALSHAALAERAGISRRAVQDAIDSLPPEWAEIDILVNNAGLSRGLEKLYTGKVEDWDEMIDTNVKGLLYVTRAVVPGMVVRKRGHVVNLGSTAGEIAYPGGAVYCGSKAAERLINDGLREDLLGTPVRVTSIDPGMVETDFALVRFHGDDDRAAKVYKGLTPLTPEDVADAIVWATSRPAHVNIARIGMTTIHQANSLLFHREGQS